MLKIAAFSLWAVIATVAVAWTQMPSNEAKSDGPQSAEGFQKDQTRTLSVALLEEDKVIGHFVTKIYYEGQEATSGEPEVLTDIMIEDALYDVIYELEEATIANLNNRRLGEIARELEEKMSEKNPSHPIRSVRLEDTQLLLRD